MRFSTSFKLIAVVAALAFVASSVVLFAQETTGGLQGTVKDASGAVISGAHVVVRATTGGRKSTRQRVNRLLPVRQLAPRRVFNRSFREGLQDRETRRNEFEIGHLPSVDITLEIGAAAEVVEVSGQAPVIDVTTNTNQTNISQTDIDNTPHGYSFQSVIQFAPMARNEPLAGGMTEWAERVVSPGSTSSGSHKRLHDRRRG